MPIIIAILKILQKTLIKMDFENIVRFLKTMKDGDQDLPGGEIASLMIRTSQEIKIPPYYDFFILWKIFKILAKI